jgi:hypothetical protein
MRPRTEIVFDTATLDATLAEIRDALEGDSNDAEHDALVAVAELFGKSQPLMRGRQDHECP